MMENAAAILRPPSEFHEMSATVRLISLGSLQGERSEGAVSGAAAAAAAAVRDGIVCSWGDAALPIGEGAWQGAWRGCGAAYRAAHLKTESVFADGGSLE